MFTPEPLLLTSVCVAMTTHVCSMPACMYMCVCIHRLYLWGGTSPAYLWGKRQVHTQKQKCKYLSHSLSNTSTKQTAQRLERIIHECDQNTESG